MKTVLTIVLCLFACLGLSAQGSVTLNAGTPATAAVPGNGTATAGTGNVAASCTIQADAFPATKITVACPLGTNGSTAGGTIVVTPGMNWPLTMGVNGNLVNITITQAATGGPVSVTATVTVNGTQIATSTKTF